MQKREFVLASIEYGKQNIKIIRILKIRKNCDYYNVDETKSELDTHYILFKDLDKEQRFRDLDEFGDYIEKESIDLLSLAQHQTHEFCSALAIFIKPGRVIQDHPLYSFIVLKYGITNLKQLSPKLDNSQCLFWLYCSTVHNPDFPLIHVNLSLKNLCFSMKEISSKNITDV